MSNNKKLNILVIDDHPLSIKGLKIALTELFKGEFYFIFDSAENYESGLEKIEASRKYNLIFLDILLKSSVNGEIFSGKDIGVKIKKLLPKTKIIVLTSLNDSYRIHKILNELSPEGFLIKSDLSINELKKAFQNIIKNPPFYSSSVISILDESKLYENFINDYDRSILYYISKGVLTKDLPDYIPMSFSAIEKRKRHLKCYFDIKEKGDTKLISEAERRNIIPTVHF